LPLCRGKEAELGNLKSGAVIFLKSQPRERKLLGWNNAGHNCELGEEWLEGSPAERGLGVLAGSRLGLNQQ